MQTWALACRSSRFFFGWFSSTFSGFQVFLAVFFPRFLFLLLFLSVFLSISCCVFFTFRLLFLKFSLHPSFIFHVLFVRCFLFSSCLVCIGLCLCIHSIFLVLVCWFSIEWCFDFGGLIFVIIFLPFFFCVFSLRLVVSARIRSFSLQTRVCGVILVAMVLKKNDVVCHFLSQKLAEAGSSSRRLAQISLIWLQFKEGDTVVETSPREDPSVSPGRMPTKI